MSTLTPTREETWNLADLYPDDGAFRAAKDAFRTDLLPRIDQYRGKLLDSPQALADALVFDGEALEELHLLHTYASLRADEDLRVGQAQAMRQEVELLATDVSQRRAFLRPELLAAAPSRIEEYLAAEPRLAPYAHSLRDLARQRKHVLTPAEETLVAETGLLRGNASALYGVLTNTELPRPDVTLRDGDTVTLTPVGFHRHRATPVREDRERIFPAYFGAYAAFKDTIAQNLYTAVKGHMFTSRVRHYPSCLATALDSDNVPVRVYHNLIEQVRRNLPVLHRYFDARKRALGVERLEYSDLHCPLQKSPAARYTIADATRLVCEGMEPLGEEYGRELRRAFESRWIDWHPATGKRSGAYASGWAYRVHPYVLMNFNGDHESVSTAAHEMGHAMHSFFSNRTQPFPTADYSIFVAEVASTFNEALLSRKMYEEAEGKDAKVSLLAAYLDGIRGTLFRQTMFAEFEWAIHDRAERGEVLTGDLLSEIYLDLLRQYHGHDEGIVHIDDRYAIEWAAIPHMYYNFYVYQYATGIVAAAALSRAVLEGAQGARDRYLAFLGSGGSDYPLEILRRAGVDLELASPYDDAFAAISERIGELETWLDG